MAGTTVDRYDPEEIREALMDLAYHRSLSRARRSFEERRGYAPTVQTLKAWREKYLDVWVECQSQVSQEIMPRVADQAEGQIVQMLDANQTMLEQLMDGLETGEIPVRELPAAIQKIAVAAGQTNEKIISPARGRPTQIIEHKQPDELFERLGELLADVPKFIDSTAEDMPEIEGAS